MVRFDATHPPYFTDSYADQLTIRNYILVDQLDISFAPGLTGITGESGAGKSILLGALGLLMGDRAKAESVRPGTEKADVSAEFAYARVLHCINSFAQTNSSTLLTITA